MLSKGINRIHIVTDMYPDFKEFIHEFKGTFTD